MMHWCYLGNHADSISSICCCGAFSSNITKSSSRASIGMFASASLVCCSVIVSVLSVLLLAFIIWVSVNPSSTFVSIESQVLIGRINWTVVTGVC